MFCRSKHILNEELWLPQKLWQLGDVGRDPPRLIITTTALKAEQQLRQLRHIDRDPPRFIFRE
jgi:hypothetical protein